MSDKYQSFAELVAQEREGVDFTIEVLSEGRDEKVVVMAPHGGAIEPHTCLVARAIAGDDLTFYAFRGTKRQGNRALHITSHRFDEPRALGLVASATRVLTVHGKAGPDHFVMVGGRDGGLVKRLEAVAKKLDLTVKSPDATVAGTSKDNICNRGATGAGAQLELSRGLRCRLADDSAFRQRLVNEWRDALLAGHARATVDGAE